MSEIVDYLKTDSTVYQEIKKKCQELNISIPELAEIANIDFQAVYRLKHNEPKVIKYIKEIKKTIQRLEDERK